MLEAGNIDLANRPKIKNPDGSTSTVFSMGVNVGGKEILIPGVGDGSTYPLRKLTTQESVQQYKKTGKHLGVFANPEASDAYAGTLHEDQAKALEPDFIPAETAKPAVTRPLASLTQGKAPTWLEDAESDVRNGGKRTALGNILGKIQGSDDGYSGLGGVSEGVQNFMGSPVLGLLHAGQSAQTIPEHPVKGSLGTIGGVMEAGTIPGLILGGPSARAAINSVPSKAAAGKVFSELAEEAGNAGIKVDLNDALSPLRRLEALGNAGHAPIRGVTQLANNVRNVPYQTARDFSSTISNLSGEERASIRPEYGAEITKLSKSLHTDIKDALAPIANGAERYEDAITEYAKASRLGDMLSKALHHGGKAAITGAGGYGAYRGLNALKSIFER